MTILGADPDHLEATAHRLLTHADGYDNASNQIGYCLRRMDWQGPEADQFRSNFESQMRPQLGAAAAFLRETASELRAQAAAQTKASQTVQSKASQTTESAIAEGAALWAAAVIKLVNWYASLSGRMVSKSVASSEDLLLEKLVNSPHPIDIYSSQVSTKGRIAFGSSEDSKVVVHTRMSDGSHRVTIDASRNILFGLGLSDALHPVLGHIVSELDLDIGFNVGPETGSRIELQADSLSDVQKLKKALNDGGVDIEEYVASQSGVSLESTTIKDIGFYAAAYSFSHEMSTSVPLTNEITIPNNSDLLVSRTDLPTGKNLTSFELHWNKEDGQVSHFVLTTEVTTVTDVRSKATKFLDFFDLSNDQTDATYSTEVTSLFFSYDDISCIEGAPNLLDEAKSTPGARVKLGVILSEHVDKAAGEHYIINGDIHGSEEDHSLPFVSPALGGIETGSLNGSGEVTNYAFSEQASDVIPKESKLYRSLR